MQGVKICLALLDVQRSHMMYMLGKMHCDGLCPLSVCALCLLTNMLVLLLYTFPSSLICEL